MKFWSLFFLIIFAVCLAASEYVPGEILIQLQNVRQDQAVAIKQIATDLPQLDIMNSSLLSARMGVWLIRYSDRSRTELEAIEELKNHHLISTAQLNHYVQERETYPDDPCFAQQWHLENSGQSGGLADADIDAPEAWDTVTGGVTALGDTIVLAIIDSGNYLEHDDLSFWKNHLEIPDNDIDDDNNGYVDDYDGWNAVYHNGNISSSSHGTHVSGIAGAIGNNATGVTGLNWNARIMPIRGSSSTESVVVEAYGYVLEMRSRYNETNGADGAFVVATNASFGVNYGNPDNFPIWCAMYDSLGVQGVLSCGATMNINVNVDEVGDMPTACDSDFLITVTNTTDEDLKNGGAAYGATTIDLGAPGTDIYSTDLNDSYSYKTGTSMACPQVTGAIGFLFSAAPASFLENYLQEPAENALLIKQYILDGTDPLADLNGITVTGGRLNINNSMQFFEPDPQQYEVSGTISEDITWEADTVHVVGDVFIEDNVTVTIPAGTRVQFEEYYNLDVQGTLLAPGTQTDPIFFTVSDTTGFSNPYLPDGGWNGINFLAVDPANEQSVFSFCIFEYGKAIENYQPVNGGCFELDSSPELEFNNCTFRNNFAGYGGAIYCVETLLTLQNCAFENNIAAFLGGAVYLNEIDQVIIESNSFIHNMSLQGGAVFATGCILDLRDSDFLENSTRFGQESAGGALFLHGTSYTIKSNNFTSNQSSGNGGGIYIEDDEFQFSNQISSNLIIMNNAADIGGALCIIDNSNISISNNLVSGSTADIAGGIYLQYANSVNILNNTIVDNTANNTGGIAAFNDSLLVITNTILWNNQANVSGNQISLYDTDISISYCDIEGGSDSLSIGDEVYYTYEDNIDSDPSFSLAGDHPYQLLITSSCINTGTPDTTGLGLPEFDLAGNPRIYEGFVTNIDIGAYEFQGDNVGSEDNLIPAQRSTILSVYPNPFNPSTTIKFSLNTESIESTENVQLCIYNIKGQKVKKIDLICHPEFIEGSTDQISVSNPSPFDSSLYSASAWQAAQGDKLRTLTGNQRGKQTGSIYSVTWDGTDDQGKQVPSGVYFSKLTAGRHLSYKKMVLLK